MKNQLQSESEIAVANSEDARAADTGAPRLTLRVISSQPRPGTGPRQTGHLALTMAETVSIVSASVAAGEAYHWLVLGKAGPLLVFLAVGLLSSIFFCGAMRAIESNQMFRTPHSIEAVRDATFVWLGTIFAVTFFAFSLKAGGTLSRGTMLSFMALGYFQLMATRLIAPRWIAGRPRPLEGRHVIVVGAEGDSGVNALLDELRAAGYTSPDLISFRAGCSAPEWQRELPRSIAQLMTSARVGGQGDICIAAGGFSDSRLRDIVGALQIVPRAVRIVPSASLEQFLHYPLRSIGALNSIELQRAPLSSVQRGLKRAMDIAFGALALAVLSPLLVLVALLIKLDSRGAILFKQTRLGERGAPFDIFKFRTMTVAENGDEVKQAQRNDARVTRVGRWLRRLSIDELPQLLNVVRGEMSLVGPRPHAMAHDRLYSSLIENYEVRQHVKPGMTGWAQANGLRGPTDAPELMRKRVEADIWYAKNASIALDIKILLLTCVEVFRQRNAH